MRRAFSAAFAAALLAGSLTACGNMDTANPTEGTTTPDGTPAGTAYDIGTDYGTQRDYNTGRPAGTSYGGSTATGPVNYHYPSDTRQTATVKNDAANARAETRDAHPGRYQASTNGRVRGMDDSAAQDARELGQDVKEGAGDLVRGTGRAVEKTGDAIEHLA